MSPCKSLIRRAAVMGVAVVTWLNASPSFGESQSLTVRWKEVRGASGYAVEWKSEGDGAAQDKRVTKGEIELSVEPGRYLMRVAALNKFGKPAAWSDWKPVTVKRQAGPAVVQLTTADAVEKPSEKPAEKTQEKTSDKSGGGPGAPSRPWSEFLAMTAFGWVPGVPQMYGGATVRGAAYAGAALVLTGYGLNERAKGRAILGDPLNDTQVIALTAFSNYPYADPAPALRLTYYVASRRADNRRAYDKHRAQVTGTAVFGALFYTVHLFEWLAMRKAMQNSVEMGVRLDGGLEYEPGRAFAPGPGRSNMVVTVGMRIAL